MRASCRSRSASIRSYALALAFDIPRGGVAWAFFFAAAAAAAAA
eukprot:CAMPEP_0181280974 /NCGR_PEP_ID=MMETSP1097-20121128/13281_1 /TAXON_ID=35684 /ORGANISM="Pseudopedinella elastica, Strain CCMP716" /LENGTH=43 /DNA_ID= /DNA_START= /DNA_END= /DNA_ORIENTATION=